jgi:hypothetical protein
MQPSDPLDTLLAEWSEPTDSPEGFRREVWDRIAREPSEVSPWERLAWWLLQPRHGVWIALLVAWIGFLYGLMRPRPSPLSAREAYVLSISPFALELQGDLHP